MTSEHVYIVIKKDKVSFALMALAFFLCMWAPATQGSSLSGTTFKLIIRYSYFVLGLGLIFLNILGKKLSVYEFILFLSPLINYLLKTIWKYGPAQSSGTSVSALLICLGVVLTSDEVKNKTFQFIKLLLVGMSFIGIICYFSYVLNLGIPYIQQPYYGYSGNMGVEMMQKFGVSYINFHVCYLYHEFNTARLCGLFNEPGWFGTFLAFYLCEENLNFKRKYNFIVLFAGILTFSLAFVLIISIYYVISNFKDWRKWTGVLLLFVIVFLVLPNIKTGIEIVDYLFSRLSITSGGLAGDNRTSSAYDLLFSEFMKSQYIFFGHGSQYTFYKLNGYIGSTIKTDLMDIGFIGTIVIYALPIVSLALISQQNKRALYFLICVAISLYQRNWFYEPSNFIIVLCAVSYIVSEMNDNQEYGSLLTLFKGRKYDGYKGYC